MTGIDVEALMLPLPGDDPCGPPLEYDPSFQAMERAAEGKPERQMGATIVPAEDPDWKSVQSLATEVLARSKDLRAAVFLARAALRTEGLDGFAAGLTVVRRFMEAYWDGVHPRLDPEDNNDPTFRMNVLDSLASLDATVRALRETPVVSSRALGRFTLRDIEIVSGAIPLPAGYPGEPPTPDRISGAFADASLEDLAATAEAIATALAQVEGIDAFLAVQLTAGSQADMEPLRRCLKSMHRPLSDVLASRGVSQGGDEGGAEQASAGAPAPPGSINSWDDVERGLDRICEFYRLSQPASPVPLLLQRARSMVRMDFMQLLEELAPAGMPEAERVLRSPKR
jgi:type VI secretion system protein ImpA